MIVLKKIFMIVIMKIATIKIVFIITDTVEVCALSIGSGTQLVLLLRLHPEQKKTDKGEKLYQGKYLLSSHLRF